MHNINLINNMSIVDRSKLEILKCTVAHNAHVGIKNINILVSQL